MRASRHAHRRRGRLPRRLPPWGSATTRRAAATSPRPAQHPNACYGGPAEAPSCDHRCLFMSAKTADKTLRTGQDTAEDRPRARDHHGGTRPDREDHPPCGQSPCLPSEMQVQTKAAAPPTPVIGPARPAIIVAAATVGPTAAVTAAPIASSPSPTSPGARRCRARREGQTRKAGNPKRARRHRPNRCRRVHGQHGPDRDAANQTSFNGTAEAHGRFDHVW